MMLCMVNSKYPLVMVTSKVQLVLLLHVVQVLAHQLPPGSVLTVGSVSSLTGDEATIPGPDGNIYKGRVK